MPAGPSGLAGEFEAVVHPSGDERPFPFSGQCTASSLEAARRYAISGDAMILDRTLMMAEPDNGDDDSDFQTGIATKTRPKTKKPSNYKVLMLNDDYTPMEFVVLVLQRYFNMGTEDATRTMLQVHQKGVAVCGIFTYEVAETKVSQVMDFARENEHPLQCTLEKA
jgi:ATP-dependent Clp protease adaptor protein ClpS